MNPKRREVLEILMNLIQSGEIVRDGKLLPEREIATRLDMSRSVVREALIGLEALGALDVRERQGVFVQKADLQELSLGLDQMRLAPSRSLPQIMEMRYILEVPATVLAARRRTDDDVANLRDCLERLEAIRKRRGPEEGPQGAYWNTILHATIIQATGNLVYSRLFEGLVSVMEKAITSLRMRYMSFPEEARGDRILDQHRRLVAAIIDRNETAARDTVVEHLTLTANNFMEQGEMESMPSVFDGKERPPF